MPGLWASRMRYGTGRWWSAGEKGKVFVFWVPSCPIPAMVKILSQGQEVKFLFIVAATLTDISVQLNKENIKYITIPKTLRRGGR